MRYLRQLILLFACLTPLSLRAETFSWSVVPQFTGTEIHRDWTPLLNSLSRMTGHQFRLKIYDSIPDFEEDFLRGDSDIAYMNPYHAVMAHRAQGYIPIIRDSASRLTGILLVRRDSPIHDIRQLQGTRIAFAAPNAFAVSLYMRALLARKEQLHIVPQYVGTHSNAYRQVLLGRVAACGGVYRTLNKERPEVRDNLRIIYRTPSTTTHPISVHPRVPEKARTDIQSALLELASQAKGQQLLNAVLLPQPVAADYRRDYQPLEELRLDNFVERPR
ncbi:phosphate/phosphite/phosphonate ABC transporter substrate-binding protein [Thiohalobacter sp. IOR34]|uniref:phosphate/phosphite/phosphonate ABC transporter substrate-binding protein n=1 Tax=Thiohalobacter sp. IOR34 TaxID=3057176 RepID=UPI0025B2509A|nr:phosphate/phosphite/phosphonate ABC transporter substrate-binding protein [Thiohalobacter sp. IOR34]WJW74416.1 phosphate/phosphite/phosphonate ABC transporter substrate-binding protein [Thiohalobacter sp. IOR34]